MASELRESFQRLNSAARAEVLLELVKVCKYEQQLHFLDLFQDHLHKDFIGLLPEQLVKEILGYLSVADAINCSLVCKRWKEVISACSGFWSQRARELGLTPAFISTQLEKTRGKGLKELCAGAVSHQKYIRSLSPHSMLLAKSPGSASASYKYAGNGIAVRYRELNGQAQVVVERIISPHSLVEIAAFSVESFRGRIKWVSSSGSYVLWKQLDGKWGGFDTTNLSSEREQWVDEPVSQGFHSISFCHSCRLIAILSEAEDDIEVWDLQVVKLEEGKSTVRKMVYPLPLERVQSAWEKKRHFLGGDITLLSETEERDADGFCESHKVLLQVDSKLVLHRLKAVPVTERLLVIHHLLPDAKLSKPLHVFSPAPSTQPLDIMDFQVSRGRPVFCYSQDYTRVALLHESYLYVWSVMGLKRESCVDLLHYNLPVDCKCVAVGGMYAVLASDTHGTCYVVVLGTGELLMHTASSAHFNPNAQRSTRFSFFPPIHQDWLSGFQYCDFWPLALVMDYLNSREDPAVEHELKALIGMQSHGTATHPSSGRVPVRYAISQTSS